MKILTWLTNCMKVLINMKENIILFLLCCLLGISFGIMFANGKEEFDHTKMVKEDVHQSIIVSPNLPCPNCKNIIYQASYRPDIVKDKVYYTCCECGYYLLITDYVNAIHRAALLKMFKQSYNKWKEKFNYDIDKAFIATFTYVNPFFKENINE